MGRAHEVRAASMAKTAAFKTKLYSRFGKEIYIAAKNGEPDPEMNPALKRKVQEAKSNQVPADVINRAIQKARGGEIENYTEVRYEGFGPRNCTLIIDCLTDNTNRSMTFVKTAFNKAKDSKMANSGSVSYNYQSVSLFIFEYNDEEKMLETLLEADVDVLDIGVENGKMVVKSVFSDFAKAQDAIEASLPDVEFDKCETAMVPNEYVDLTDPFDIANFNKLIDALNDIDDVNKIYHNAHIEEK